MAEAVYLLCAITSIACAWLLLSGYRANRTRLLFWSCVGFVGLAVNNVLLFVDLVLVPTAIDLSMARVLSGAIAMLALVVGLVWETR